MKTAFYIQAVTVLFLTAFCRQQQRKWACIHFIDRAADYICWIHMQTESLQAGKKPFLCKSEQWLIHVRLCRVSRAHPASITCILCRETYSTVTGPSYCTLCCCASSFRAVSGQQQWHRALSTTALLWGITCVPGKDYSPWAIKLISSFLLKPPKTIA